MSANPNSAWGCQAREYISQLARNASGDDAEQKTVSPAVEGDDKTHCSAVATAPAGTPGGTGDGLPPSPVPAEHPISNDSWAWLGGDR